MTTVDPNSTTPLYRQLAGLLRAQIAAGEFERGRLPSEAQLGDVHGISRITIRQALADLEREGLVTRVPGKGTFTAPKKQRLEALTRLSSFSEDAASAGLRAAYRVLHIGFVPIDAETADALGVAEPDALLVERVLLADGVPMGMHRSYLPHWLVTRADPAALTPDALRTGSLYRAIEGAQLEIHRAVETLKPARIARSEADALGLDAEALVLHIQRTIYDRNGRPLAHELDAYLPDVYTYRVELFRRSKTG